MGWSNGPGTWHELERRLSDRWRPSRPAGPDTGPDAGADPDAVPGDGGDSPAWSRKRAPYEPSGDLQAAVRRHPAAGGVPYAELHCHSNFSFLDGASHPEELVEEAVRLGLEALALTDHDGLYGVVRFAEAARAHGLATVFGAELTLDVTAPADRRVGQPDPEGRHLVVLARDPVGYGRLARAVSAAHLAAGEKGAPRLDLDALAALAAGDTGPFQRALRSMPAPEVAVAVARGGAARAGEVAAPAAGEQGVLDVLRAVPLRDGVRADRAALDAAIRRHPAAGRATRPASPVPASDATGGAGGHWLVLTGCRKGTVPAALLDGGPRAAARELDRLVEAFGRDNVAVEIWDHGDPLDSARNDALAELAARRGVDLVATNNVHYAGPSRRRLATALAAVRARRSLDEIDGWLPAAAGAHLRSGTEQARRLARYPGAVERAAALARACAFDLALVAPKLPPFPCPPGHDEMSWLRVLTEEGAVRRYGRRVGGPRGADGERVRGAYAQIDHELALIEHLGFAGYFLVVWDLVEFCRRSGIYCQGRGSAANSAVCYALGITNADAVSLGLLFERFLSPERDGPPDIDIDIESDRREEVIQYVYARHGREHAAQVANVITYRSRSSVRDMGRALGHSPGQLDAWSKQLDPWGRVRGAGGEELGIPAPVLALAEEVEDFPRHLGIHSGGMVICDRPVVEVCPVEWGRLAGPAAGEEADGEPGEGGRGSPPSAPSGPSGPTDAKRWSRHARERGGTPLRTVLQWDKDDCAATGLVKFDLLGLGMLTALHRCVDLVREHHGVDVDIALLPQEDEVYEMLCRADSVGVFQVESRAQMATLPRLRPRCFYDLVVEVALIRPGPIQGGSVHPYIRRRNGEEPVTYLHPLLEKSLQKTLGIPLFQEQLMQMAIDVAGFTPGEADQLRQAMGSKRSSERMDRLKARLYEGMAGNGITGETADILWDKLAAFANYGFPESHSVSFAYLVYASSWLKLHYPAAFCAALLDAQPMGFYSPQSLVADARRHGVSVLGPDVNASRSGATLDWVAAGFSGGRPNDGSGPGDASGPVGPQPAVRLGLADVRHVGHALGDRIEAERRTGGPFTDLVDLAQRTGLGRPALEALATAGALAALPAVPGGAPLGEGDRRAALWAAGALAAGGPDRLAGVVTGVEAPTLPGMAEIEVAAADLWATGVTPGCYPTELFRDALAARGVVPAAALRGVAHGTRVWVGGVVTHRQRPATAGGTTFVNLEDESGLVNVICSKGVWGRYRRVARGAPALLVRGILERTESSAGGDAGGAPGTVVLNVIADRIEPLLLPVDTGPSRDFH